MKRRSFFGACAHGDMSPWMADAARMQQLREESEERIEGIIKERLRQDVLAYLVTQGRSDEFN